MASLVAQWLRSHLPPQGTQVRSLVWEDPTCLRMTKCMHHNYWGSYALEHMSLNYWAHMLQVLGPMCWEPKLHKKSHCHEKPTHHN